MLQGPSISLLHTFERYKNIRLHACAYWCRFMGIKGSQKIYLWYLFVINGMPVHYRTEYKKLSRILPLKRNISHYLTAYINWAGCANCSGKFCKKPCPKFEINLRTTKVFIEDSSSTVLPMNKQASVKAKHIDFKFRFVKTRYIWQWCCPAKWSLKR